MSAPSFPNAPKINPALLTERWSATWCRHPDGPHTASAVFLFRLSLDLETVPESFVVHVSADQRYRFFVNGVSATWGPARGDLLHWRFETVDIAPLLKPGKNSLAAVVHFFEGEIGPQAQVSYMTAFLCQGDTQAESSVNTPGAWKVWHDTAYTFDRTDADLLYSYVVIGPSELFDASKHPWEWQSPDFDDSAWPMVARVPGPLAAPHGLGNAETPWWLVPRPIPAMEETPQRFARLARTEGVTAPEDWPAATSPSPIQIPPHTRVVLLLDQGVETTGFPEVVVSGGAGAALSLRYAEALVEPITAYGYSKYKGNRNEVVGRVLKGYADYWTLDGGANRLLRPLWWRTFRYSELTVETADEPLTLSDLRSVFTAYPFTNRSRFATPEIPDAPALIEIGWRTARLCAQETYTDCPYYEQLQYVGDTRIQCLVTYYGSGDPLLWRNALAQIDESRIPAGLTQSRYPTRVPQVISPFSLWYICMIHDYWQHVPNDDPFLRSLLPGVRSVLEWFQARLRPDGLLGKLEFWNFADWADEWHDGEPPGAAEGGSSILTLQYALAAKAAGELLTAFGYTADGRQWTREGRMATQAVRRSCYDVANALVADTPAKTSFSQHAAALGVLAGAVPSGQAKAVIERALSDTSLTQATFYFRFYLNRALVKAGLGDRYLETIEPWRKMREIGLTTWAEKPEPTRSDCHAWSCSPNYEFLATVLGILPDAPGFSRVRITPHLGGLTTVSGSIPHPQGEVSVDLQRSGDTLTATVALPASVPGLIVWEGEVVALKGGSQTVTLTAKKKR